MHQEKGSVDRRSFLKAAATSGAAFVGSQALGAQQAEQAATAAPAQADAPTVVEITNDEKHGSDFMQRPQVQLPLRRMPVAVRRWNASFRPR